MIPQIVSVVEGSMSGSSWSARRSLSLAVSGLGSDVAREEGEAVIRCVGGMACSGS